MLLGTAMTGTFDLISTNRQEPELVRPTSSIGRTSGRDRLGLSLSVVLILLHNRTGHNFRCCIGPFKFRAIPKVIASLIASIVSLNESEFLGWPRLSGASLTPKNDYPTKVQIGRVVKADEHPFNQHGLIIRFSRPARNRNT